MYKVRKRIGSVISVILKLIVSFIFIFPFLWMLSVSLQSDAETQSMSLTLIPKTPQFQNYVNAWNSAPFPLYIRNSLLVIAGIVVLQMLIMVPAAYAFAKMEFKGKNILFGIILIAFMMPIQIRFIPIYFMMSDWNLMDTLWPQILPHMTDAFGIFLLRQYFMQVPDELIEAAKLDKSTDLQIMWKIMLPMSRPGVASVVLLSFVGHWNDYFWPLVMTNSDSVRPITIGVASLKATEGSLFWNTIMAGNMFLVIPVLIIYFLMARNIIKSFTYTGIK